MEVCAGKKAEAVAVATLLALIVGIPDPLSGGTAAVTGTVQIAIVWPGVQAGVSDETTFNVALAMFPVSVVSLMNK